MARYRRLQAVVSVGRDIDELFERFFGTERGEAVWQPLADLFVTEKKVHLLVEIPGVEVSDIRLTVGPTSVQITGRKRVPDVVKRGVSFYEAEIPYGEFDKRVRLPFPVNPESYKIEVENGVLSLVLDRAGTGVRVIEIE